MVWPRLLSGGPGRPDSGADERTGHSRGDAHGSGQIRLLSAARFAVSGYHAGGIAPDRPDEGSGHGAEAKRRGGGLHQFQPDPRPAAGGHPPGEKRRVQDHLRGSRAPADSCFSGFCHPCAHFSASGGRSPLRFPVGAGLSPQLSQGTSVLCLTVPRWRPLQPPLPSRYAGT